MYTDLNVFKLAHAMARHAGKRQAIVAQNMANADTPGYRARDIDSFTKTFQQADPAAMRATRTSHIAGPTANDSWRTFETKDPTDPNGNSVSIEQEMLRSVEVKKAHDRALAIYRTSLSVIRASIGQR